MTSDWFLSQFSKNFKQVVLRYQTFVEDGLAEGYRKEFHKGGQDGRLLGNDDFAETVFRNSMQEFRKRISLEEIIALVCSCYSIQPGDLAQPGKQRRASEARNIAAWLVLNAENLSLTEFGERVGRDISSLSQGVIRMLKRAESDSDLAGRMKQIKSRLKST